MKRKIDYNPYSTKNALYVSLAIPLFEYLLIMTTSYMIFKHNIIVPRWTIASDVIISYLVGVILMFIMFKFSFWLAQKNIEPVKKHLFILLGLILITTPLSLLFSVVLDWLLFNPNMYLENIAYKKLFQDFIYAFIVFLITVSIYAMMHGQKVEAENIRNRYEALKNRLDPHFLFNSLNTLDGLIGQDDEKAHRYLQKLSQTFRYTVQNKEITELNDELKLVDAYYYLMKIRYGDNLTMNMSIDDRYHSCLILPVSLQLLVENAIKHNTINDNYPLYINMEMTGDKTIRVTNNKNRKLNDTTGSRIGLENLAERFMLIFDKDIKIEDKADSFSVELPLIETFNV
jgi:Putative regulator of cell autolysis